MCCKRRKRPRDHGRLSNEELFVLLLMKFKNSLDRLDRLAAYCRTIPRYRVKPPGAEVQVAVLEKKVKMGPCACGPACGPHPPVNAYYVAGKVTYHEQPYIAGAGTCDEECPKAGLQGCGCGIQKPKQQKIPARVCGNNYATCGCCGSYMNPTPQQLQYNYVNQQWR